MEKNNYQFLKVFYAALFILMISILNAGCKTEPVEETIPRLKEEFDPYFLMGGVLNERHVMQPDYKVLDLVKEQFSVLTAENKMKWESIHPLPGEFDFEASDKFVEFAEENNMKIIGHTLIWHSQTPDWVFEDEQGKLLNRDQLIERMRNHILSVVGRYKGRIHGWDVVNEAILDNGRWRESKWRQIIGEDYIQLAFQFAAEADPDAELYYNDYSLFHIEKRKATIRLINNLADKGIKISGIGMQGHYHLDEPGLQAIEETIVELSSTGADIMITELDISVLPWPSEEQFGADVSTNFEYNETLNPFGYQLPDSIQNQLAKRYADIFNIFVRNSNVISRVSFWGVHDGDSWLNSWPVNNRENHPLLFDRNLLPKKAFHAVIETTKGSR